MRIKLLDTLIEQFLRLLPERILRRVGIDSLCIGSAEFRAFLDLFIPPHNNSRVRWKSGIGNNVYVLYGLARALEPEVVVEIGSSRGKSTCAFALACRHNARGKVYAIDPHTVNGWSDTTDGGTEQFLRNRLQDYGLEQWCEIIRATSEEAVKTWSLPIDLLFIDGDHTLEGVRHDFEAFRPWLTENGLVVFHDTTWEYYKKFYDEHSRHRQEMGVPRYMYALQQAGYRSVTLYPMPGLTILDPKKGGFAFLPQADSSTPSREGNPLSSTPLF